MEARVPTHRRIAYKSKGTFQADELRRRRETQSVEIRRQKREESLAKKRNFNVTGAVSDSEDEDGGADNLHSQVHLQHTYIYHSLDSMCGLSSDCRK